MCVCVSGTESEMRQRQKAGFEKSKTFSKMIQSILRSLSLEKRLDNAVSNAQHNPTIHHNPHTGARQFNPGKGESEEENSRRKFEFEDSAPQIFGHSVVFVEPSRST